MDLSKYERFSVEYIQESCDWKSWVIKLVIICGYHGELCCEN